MKSFSDKYYPYTVVFRRRLDAASDEDAGETPKWETPGVIMSADVQAASPTRNQVRIDGPGVAMAETRYIIHTLAEPPVTTDDRADWLGRILMLQGPPMPGMPDELGVPANYTVEAVERK